MSDWHGLYSEGWQGEIVPEAFSHPAKYARALIRHIYDHAIIDEGWMKPGDTVIDPFGGVGLGGIDAMRHGLHWVGVELEPKFVDLGNQNIALWNERYAGKLPRWGSAVLLQGDSRLLAKVVGGADGVLTSPPYADGCAHTGGDDPHPEHIEGGEYHGVGLDGAISSPPYAESMERKGGIDPAKSVHIGGPHSQMNNSNTRYGSSPGQLGAMKAGDFSVALSSPPYADISQSGGTKGLLERGTGLTQGGRCFDEYGATPGQLGAMKAEGYDGAVSSPPFLAQSGGTNVASKTGPLSDPRLLARHSAGNAAAEGYGTTPGQLATMDATVSSPPFESTLGRDIVNAEARRKWAREHGISNAEHVSPIDMGQIGARDQGYGSTAGNIGNSSGDDFWTAARQIVDQVYLLLKPGGVAVWVVKSFIKNKAIVDFPGQWERMCQAAGFETLHIHRAWLVEEKGTQLDFAGNGHKKVVERKSFFRRLAEKKGSPRIDWETVLCMHKPSGNGHKKGEIS